MSMTFNRFGGHVGAIRIMFVIEFSAREDTMKAPIIAAVLGIIAFASSLLADQKHAAAQGVNCGDTITTNTRLTDYLYCFGFDDPIILDSARLDLGGYGIGCDGAAAVVMVGSGAVLRNGSIGAAGCVPDGIVVEGDGNHALENIFIVGGSGILVTSNNNMIRDNRMGGEGGLDIEGDNNIIVNNVIGDSFVRVIGGDGNMILHNRSPENSSGPAHIILGPGADNTKVIGNVLKQTFEGGGISIESANNHVSGNKIRDNEGTGILVMNGATGNRITGNKVTGNNPDVDDENADCDANFWRGNRFNTSGSICLVP